MGNEIEMPRYRSCNEVRALKIAAVEFHDDGSATIEPEDTRYAPLKTRAGWQYRFDGMDEGENTDLGYYVVYADGFTSWSPTVAFDNGYTPV